MHGGVYTNNKYGVSPMYSRPCVCICVCVCVCVCVWGGGGGDITLTWGSYGFPVIADSGSSLR